MYVTIPARPDSSLRYGDWSCEDPGQARHPLTFFPVALLSFTEAANPLPDLYDPSLTPIAELISNPLAMPSPVHLDFLFVVGVCV